MVRVSVLEGGKVRLGGIELLEVPGPKWIDVDAQNEALLAPLVQKYGLHRLAIEDCLNLNQRPKLEDYGDHHFIVVQVFSAASGSLSELVMHEMHLFIGADWLITVHERQHEAVAGLHARVAADPEGTLRRGLGYTAYLLIDALVDRIFPVTDAMQLRCETLQDEVFSKPSPELMETIVELRATLTTVRRILGPQREVLAQLAKLEIPGIHSRTRHYFRDVADHLVRVYEQLDGARETLADAMDAYTSVMAHRTNEVSRQLTIFASIFLPLSFIVGFFGQNFELLGHMGFFWVAMGSMVLLPAFMLVWFRRKGWL